MEDLKSKVSDWLEKEGYPLEMHVAAEFIKAGFQVAQSVFYVDEETKSTREVDLMAFINYPIGTGWLTFSIVIECKASKSKPWIAFITNDTTNDALRLERFLYNQKSEGLIRVLNKGMKSMDLI